MRETKTNICRNHCNFLRHKKSLYLTGEQKLNNPGKKLGEPRGATPQRAGTDRSERKMRKGDNRRKKQERKHN